MKTVVITIEQGEDETKQQHNIECVMALSGESYHQSLRSVFDVLFSYREADLGEEAATLLRDIRNRTAKHFKGVHHE